MAATAATAMSHSMPPLPMTSAPRIRPPRIPKGTPNINTEPQPEGKVPKNKVWVQGKWREPSSRAAQNRQEIYSRRVEKALRHETLGRNIYAYNHIRTKQVVYSLTRHMENTKIMEQLLFHGKKTVPEALRRDMWTPYFSLHFPPTLHGAEAGKLAYQRLRELSLQRQLSPPQDMVIATRKDIADKMSRYDPITLKDMLERRELKELPKRGDKLPKKLLAKRLMDQKATSVADAQFVTDLYLKGPTPAEQRRAQLRKFELRMARMGRRAITRLQKIRLLEARRRDLIRLLAAEAQSSHRGDGRLTLTEHAAARISSEYLGKIRIGEEPSRLSGVEAANERKLRESMADVQAQIDLLLSGQPLAATQTVDTDVEASANATGASPKADEVASNIEETADEPELMVKMMWADQRDSAYAAKEWPQGVEHGSLERSAVSRPPGTRLSRSIHVIGGEQGSLWAPTPEQASAARQKREGAYKQRQDAAQSIEGKMVEAVQILRDELDEELPKEKNLDPIEALQQELQGNEGQVATSDQTRIYQRTALEQDWWALAEEDRIGISQKHAVLLAQVLMDRQLGQVKGPEAGVSKANEAAARVSVEDGVEIDAPKASLFNRLKALVWRR